MNQEQIRNEFNNKIRNNFIQAHNLCQYCGKEAKHIHHLIPISKGGDNRESNLIPLCFECHGLIHGKTFNDNWKELQRIGIEKAKAKGKFRGGQIKKISKEKYLDLKQKWQIKEITKSKFAELLGVSRPTLNKILKEEDLYLKNFEDTACIRAADKLVLVRNV